MATSSMIAWSQRSRWTVLMAGCWVEATSGLTYVYSTYSPALKSQLSYDQRHINKLAAAKDLGEHIGLAAGFLCRVWPNWAVLSLGSLLILLGYGTLWLLTNHIISSLPFWLVCIILFLGTNGLTFLDTPVLLTSIPNFPSNRATVVGLLKGFKGLSGAIFNQIYASFLAPDEANFILVLALGPAVVMVPLIFLMGTGTAVADNLKEDITCRLLFVAASFLAAYMLTVALLQDLYSIDTAINIVLTVVLFLILLLPLPISQIADYCIKKHKESVCQLKEPLLPCGDCEAADNNLICSKALLEAPRLSYSGNLRKDVEDNLLHSTASDPGNLASENDKFNASFPAKQIITGGVCSTESGGADYTLQRALKNANFWLLVFSIFFSMGTGTTAFDNLSQVVQSQGYNDTELFVSLCNTWNFMGRLAGGYASEVSTRGHGHPRTLILAVAQFFMAVGHVLFATALPGTIHIAVFLVAMGYGAEWAIFPTALSELFGLQNFGVLYNFVNIASPVGSLIYSTCIAGPLYDQEARKQSGATSDDETSLVCEGTVCFELTFFILTAVCLTGSALSIALTLRTRKLYTKR